MGVAQLKACGEGLWYGEAPVRFFGMRIVTRMSVIRLPDGALLVISPLILTPDLERELRALGPVREIASPNKIHNQGLESFARAWPEARLWASPGLPERRPDLRFHGTLGDEPEAPWRGVVDQICTQGNVFFSEVVFFHRPSRTLIVADLVENLVGEAGLTWAGRLMMRAMGIYGKALPSPELRMFTMDGAAAAEALDRIAAWPFERILLAHGALIESDAHAVLRSVRDRLVIEAETRPRWRAALWRAMAKRE